MNRTKEELIQKYQSKLEECERKNKQIGGNLSTLKAVAKIPVYTWAIKSLKDFSLVDPDQIQTLKLIAKDCIGTATSARSGETVAGIKLCHSAEIEAYNEIITDLNRLSKN